MIEFESDSSIETGISEDSLNYDLDYAMMVSTVKKSEIESPEMTQQRYLRELKKYLSSKKS